MKIKIKKTERDFTADYYNASDMHLFRSGVLEFIIKSESDTLLFIDTNSSVKKLTESKIEEVLNGCGLNYLKKQIPSTEKKLFGIATFFGGKNKNKKPECLFAVELSSEDYSIDLYNGFLKYYDYAVIIGSRLPMNEALSLMAEDYDEILFNAQASRATAYDSILFARFRIAPNSKKLEEYIGKAYL